MIAVTVAGTGFITARSSLGADLSLLAELVAVVLLTVGVIFAVRHDYRAHRAFQTAGVIVSLIPALLWMVPSLWKNTLPDLPGNLSDSSQLLTVIHATVGVVAVVFGLVLVIRANQRMAAGASLSGYKTAMRAAYVLYVLGAVLGVAVYRVVYG